MRRTLRIALVLLALAVFAGATMMAASATAQKSSFAVPKMPAMVPSLDKIASKIGLTDNIGSKAIDDANVAASNAVKGKAAKVTYDIQKNIVQSFGKMSNKASMTGMGSVNPQLDHLRQMPAMAAMNMPDWTTPGIIFTL
ncbi:hypothetical protein [Methanocella sp. MCL-LM]|uniref:hypothetical protein n=1 Tax=Methanocella sp. MCL-LM TaxID=3412035 RepID=UPI003C70FB31